MKKGNKKQAGKEIQKRFLDPKDFTGGLKLFGCNVLTGVMKEYKWATTYVRDAKKNVFKRIYIYPDPQVVYLATTDMDRAEILFTEQFAQMAVDIEKEQQEAKAKAEWREKHEGWDAWGNEVVSDVVL